VFNCTYILHPSSKYTDYGKSVKCPFAFSSDAVYMVSWELGNHSLFTPGSICSQEQKFQVPIGPWPVCSLELVFMWSSDTASAVTAREKSSIYTNRKSTIHYPLSLRCIVYVDPKSLKGGSEM